MSQGESHVPISATATSPSPSATRSSATKFGVFGSNVVALSFSEVFASSRKRIETGFSSTPLLSLAPLLLPSLRTVSRHPSTISSPFLFDVSPDTASKVPTFSLHAGGSAHRICTQWNVVDTFARSMKPFQSICLSKCACVCARCVAAPIVHSFNHSTKRLSPLAFIHALLRGLRSFVVQKRQVEIRSYSR